MEFGDGGKLTLNEAQYDMLLARLDPQSAEKMNPFHKVDKRRNGTINLREFQREIDLILKPKHKRNKLDEEKRKKKKGGKWSAK